MSTILLTPPSVERLEKVPHNTSPAKTPWQVLAAMAAYTVMILAVVARHEPWADEAQAWLLARDSGIAHLWTTLLHYEGSPGLWQSLLHVFIALGFPYSAFNYIAAGLGIASAWLLLRYSPFPLAIRLLLPFTFFLGYQYVVIARSYDLVPLLLFSCAATYLGAERRPWLFTSLLCLLAAISVHGLVLSACIVLTFGVTRRRRWREWAGPMAVYLVVVAMVMAAAYPAKDVNFATHPKFSLDNCITFSQDTLRDTFTGEGYSTALALALSIPFLWRGRGLLMFVMSTLILCTFGAIVYAHVWHQGLIFLAWLFSLWISGLYVKPTKMAIAAMAIVIAAHCYWTAASIAYDWNHTYSAGQAAARFLRSAHVPRGQLYAVGYASTAAKPYFPPGTFAGGPAYWDWSIRNKMNDAPALLASHGREFVVVGYKSRLEQDFWANLLLPIGYSRIKQFQGGLYWHDHVLEPESIDIFHLGGAAPTVSMASAIPMNSNAFTSQLLSGFYPVEGNAWRWTAKTFSVALKPPAGSERNGAAVQLNLFLPGEHSAPADRLTVHADVDGFALPSYTFSAGGAQTYTARIPAKHLNSDAVCITFQLNKSAVTSSKDSRELGAIATSVSLTP